MKRAMVWFFVFLAALAVLGAIPANATILGTAYIDSHNNNLSDTGTLYGDGYPGGIYAYTGVYSWTNEGGHLGTFNTGLGIIVPNWGFCIEMPQTPVSGWVNVVPLEEGPMDDTPPMGTTKANYIRELWGRDFDPSWATGANRQMAGAFSLAIWEIIYETDPRPWDVTSGAGFYATGIGQEAATANAWLAGLDGTGPRANLVAICTTSGQDYVVQVPEPATIALLGLGALALIRKRKA